MTLLLCRLQLQHAEQVVPEVVRQLPLLCQVQRSGMADEYHGHLDSRLLELMEGVRRCGQRWGPCRGGLRLIRACPLLPPLMAYQYNTCPPVPPPLPRPISVLLF